MHSTSGLGLPRVVPYGLPNGGLTISGRFFKEGTILSVPSYTIHRDVAVWGEDADQFRPERWIMIKQDEDVMKELGGTDSGEMQRTFNPFSYGPTYVHFIPSTFYPYLAVSCATFMHTKLALTDTHPRACLGRNLAHMELFVVIASIFHRYEFSLELPGSKVGSHIVCYSSFTSRLWLIFPVNGW